MTNAERKKKFLEKLKASGSFDAFIQERAADEKRRRDQRKAGLLSLPKAEREKKLRLNRAYSRKKMEESRQRKKPKHNAASETTTASPIQKKNVLKDSYNTSSALQKAAAKIKRSLPSAPIKKKQALAKVLHSLDKKDFQEVVENKVNIDGDAISATSPKSSRATSPDDIELVRSFFEKDDVSRMSANMRDCRKFYNPVTFTKELKQTRFLMYRLTDVYNLFVKHIQNGE